MSKQKRPVASYLKSARELDKFAPALRKYRRRHTRLTPWEKGAITRKENLLRYHTHQLYVIPKKHRRILKNRQFAPGIPALELRNVSGDDLTHEQTIIPIDEDFMLRSNGRQWVYWQLDREEISKKGMKKAAQAAFNIQFPLERIAELAGLAFEELKPLAIHLWVKSGRANRGFDSFKQFMFWLNNNWGVTGGSEIGLNPAEDPREWINGIAILVKDPNWRKPRSVLRPPQFSKKSKKKSKKK
jgi:hypothetical protein